MGALMTTLRAADGTDIDDPRPATLVWIDSREAVIVSRREGRTQLERVESEVPAHRRATGHVRHEPAVRHGGGGSPQSAGEPHRLEHLKRFVTEIASRLAPDDELLIIGPGTVHERLARQVTESDLHRGHPRAIVCEASRPLTDRQLIARLLRFTGVEPRRRTVGAYRWTLPGEPLPSGRARAPRRIGAKPPPDRGGTPQGSD
jgi:hypothetical protein